MKRWQFTAVVFGIALIAGAGGFQLQQYLRQQDSNSQAREVPNPYKPKIESVVGTQVSDFSLSDVNGEQRSLSEWQGKVIALNFWATWCEPCRHEIPAFVELQEQYATDGLQFVGIALHTADEIKDFITEFNVNYPSLVGNNEVIALGKKLGNDIGALPYTVIIDRDGKIAFTRRGPLLKVEAEEVINTLL